MKRKALRKLQLSAETLRHLDPAVLGKAEGGGRTVGFGCNNTLMETCNTYCSCGVPCNTAQRTCMC
jgi:hypothetical protein